MQQEETSSLSPIAAYGRLSREEVSDGSATTIEEKVQLRKEVLITLARHYHLELTPEQITFELLPGSSLTERPGLVALLDRCARREIHTLIIFDIDRLTRDVSDWKTIERALFRGQIRLITGRGDYHFTPAFDPTMLQILAVLGERERRGFSFRHKAANNQRARKGHKSGGRDPYGYRWDEEAKRWEPTEQYPVVEEIFRRIWDEGGQAIANDFNRRGVLPPTKLHFPDRSAYWTVAGVVSIAQNPIYAGYVVKRRERDREGRIVELPRSQWIWSEEQDYPHPVSLARWEAIYERITSRRFAVTGKTALLTGPLRCCHGRLMHHDGNRYICQCHLRMDPHSGQAIQTKRLDPVVLAYLEARYAALPPEALAESSTPTRQRTEEPATARIARALREKTSALEKLQEDAAFLDSLPGYGREKRFATMRTLAEEIVALECEQQAAEAAERKQRITIPRSVQEQITAAGGLVTFLMELPPKARRQMVQTLVIRIDLIAPPPGKRTNTVEILAYPPIGTGDPERLELPSWTRKSKT